MGTAKVSSKVVQEGSRDERLDGLSALRDAVKAYIIAPSVHFASTRSNRLIKAVEFVLKHHQRFSDDRELVSYAKYVAGESTADYGHIRPIWVYVSRAPRVCKMFVDGLADESALRYAGADKVRVQPGRGEEAQWVHLQCSPNAHRQR